ncbi:MAG TPA: phospholipase [Bacteroidales bacterium]|nr:phospholipase [Bacteroidales bacterium]
MTTFIWILFTALVLLGLFSWLLSKHFTGKAQSPADGTDPAEQDVETDLETDDDVCCGQHLVCEKDSLMYQGEEIVYYDDDELDAYKGKAADAYTGAEIKDFEDVFYTLQESDMAGWLRSLQLREINLPLQLRDEALMIVSERRQNIQ